MPDTFAEFHTVKASDPLRQGDILEAAEAGATKWQRHLFVITADCDFANAKHHRRVTCIPLLTVDEYLLEMHLPRLRERLEKKPLSELVATLRRAGAVKVTDERVRSWVIEQGAEGIFESVEIPPSDREIVERTAEAIRLLYSESSDLAVVTRAIVEAQMIMPSPPSRANAVGNVRSAVKEAYIHPPGDAMFIGALSPNHHDGYFAYLRHLEQVWEPDIALRPTRRNLSYRRVARLQDRFTHALVQRFGMVFMSIGLPAEYEEIRNLHSEILTSEIA